MNPSPATTAAAEINRLHEEAKGCSVASRKALQGALAAANDPGAGFFPPMASDPVSPMKTLAGWQLNHRNPSPAPTSAMQSTASSPLKL